MKRRRDPLDERHDERLAGSSLASLLLHLLAVAFLVSIAAASSQESSTESVYGGALLTISQQVATAAATPRPAPSRPPPVHRVAPARRPPQHRQRRPHVALHELTHVVPSASPNPTSQPLVTPQPLPAPTINVAIARPTVAPSAPVTPEPTARPVPTERPTAKPQPTAKPVPTQAPTAKPMPTVAPTARPAPTHAPTIAPAPVVARTAAPQPTSAVVAHAAPVVHPSAAPASKAGAASPKPVVARHPTTGRAQPGPQSQSIGHMHVPQRPISIAPTPSPVPTQRPVPAPTRNPYAGLNARLNAMLPHGPVHVETYHYVGSLSLAGRLVPTPPPSVVARTRYIFEAPFGGGDGTMRMWVTGLTRRGPALLCTGWILHFPETIAQGMLLPPGVRAGGSNGIQIGAQHPVSSGLAAGMAPIVVGMGSAECTQRALHPFTPGSSP